MGAYFRDIGRHLERVLEYPAIHAFRSAITSNHNAVYDACFYPHIAAIFNGIHFEIADRGTNDLLFAKQWQVVLNHDFVLIIVSLFMVVFGA